jgi:hypothetical protein
LSPSNDVCTYFSINEYVVIDTKIFLSRPNIDKIYLVEFSPGDLECPDTEPLGMFFENGIRKYLWGNHMYAEYALDYRLLSDKILYLQSNASDNEYDNYKRLLGFLFKCQRSPAPNTISYSIVDHMFVRAVYRVD